MVDKVLIERIKQKDEDAFTMIFDKYKNLVYYITFQATKNHEVSEGLLQETFIRAYSKIDQYNGGNFKYWLVTIAKNLTSNYLTREFKKEQAVIHNDEYVETIASNEPDSLGKYESILTENFTQLEKDIIVYKVIWGYKFKEIAKILNENPKYVSLVYKSSLVKLRKIMGDL